MEEVKNRERRMPDIRWTFERYRGEQKYLKKIDDHNGAGNRQRKESEWTKKTER